MTNYLDKIIKTKSEVVEVQKSSQSLQSIKIQLKDSAPRRGFISAIQKRHDKGLVSVIAEVKKASPSKGIIREDFSPEQIAQQYEENGATCLSVLTDEEYFQGSLDYLKNIRAEVNLPLLRKDFLIDEYQIYQSKFYGADCVLLIASALSDNQLLEYKNIAEELDLDVLVEIHDEEELERILPIDFSLIGINNRNLSTFEVNLETTKNLSMRLGDKLVVSESGIKTKRDINQVLSYQVLNFLVGESFMRAKDPGLELNKLFFLEN
ncbi:MAG: indole-3-glycerol phosphate synthase TrpC [SAR86 cluster bacterium]|nr:indole-3-glycerol phosphate synthase TrpC [SAR86 cluster bacterium]